MSRFEEGKQQSYETVQQYRRKDGSPIWVHAYVSRMQGNESKPPLFLATTIDITDRKRAEAASRDALSELARVARLTTMGEMTAYPSPPELRTPPERSSAIRDHPLDSIRLLRYHPDSPDRSQRLIDVPVS